MSSYLDEAAESAADDELADSLFDHTAELNRPSFDQYVKEKQAMSESTRTPLHWNTWQEYDAGSASTAQQRAEIFCDLGLYLTDSFGELFATLHPEEKFQIHEVLLRDPGLERLPHTDPEVLKRIRERSRSIEQTC